jgi:hypothetical protein
MGQALLQAVNCFSQAALALSFLAEERQSECADWQLSRHMERGTNSCAAAGSRNDWTSGGSTILASGVSSFAVEALDIAKDDAESRTAIAIRVNLVIRASSNLYDGLDWN